MKILQIGKFYPIRGGVEKVMYDLTAGLSEAGIACDMLCATTENHPGGVIQLNALGRIIAIRTQIKFAATMIAPAMVLKLRRIASDYDIIHIHHPDPMACLALFLSGYKGKVVLHWHSDILKQKTLLKLYRPLQDWLINRADRIVGTTPVYVQQSDFLQGVQHKIDFIPIGVEPVKADPKRVTDIRSQYPDRKLVFSLGRLVEYKGYRYLLDAAKTLDPSYMVLIGGMGPQREELLHIIQEHGLQNKVALLGYIADDDVPNYFAACDVFCLSSTLKTEAFAIVQIEAMSCSKPVVSTHIPGSGVDWVNQHGESGVVVPKEDGSALAKAFEQVIEDPAYYQKLANGASARFEAYFTRDRMVAAATQLYQKLEMEK
ncbi:glycosyltransferase [Sphingobacterium alkalisoli]|uniref:Glycosyltransferase n=2 Tax=Sphingobacterium alkalisoli TaxID=1874115 RepID=A0A4U0GN74_9SPHI|nr:glycosyltransferase [Sphingobacterium alkalisoli]